MAAHSTYRPLKMFGTATFIFTQFIKGIWENKINSITAEPYYRSRLCYNDLWLAVP